jgi:hypothetical protein
MHRIQDINKRLFTLLPACMLAGAFFGCKAPAHRHLFQSLSPAESGIHFSNTIREDDSTQSFIDEFGYMGGGVGIGDFNNDGLKDIFFTGNQVSCRLYINKGENKFEDITLPAGLTTHVWATGVSIADVNHDGYDDIYVCVFGKNLLQPARNLLFINQHDLTFKEQAAEYGLADTGYSTQAVFFDYDLDGDLDMYLSNYRLNGPNANTLYPRDLSGFSPANDRLYRNDGGALHPTYTDATRQAGILEDGYGLGVVASDLNGDGWPDIYVANDFVSNDELWLNNHDGTFTNCISRSLGHQSYSSMGVDAADINNDGLPDIVTLDMLPEDNTRRKLASSIMTYDRYQEERSLGYEPEFMRNMLQLNNGNQNDLPFFSEIGRQAGIPATDWSWSVLLGDFDNDGWNDIHITNGIGRDFINADFLEFSSRVFATTRKQEDQHRLIREKLAALKHITLPNYLYLNNGNYTFTDASAQAGIDEPSMSNGAAYADLDNDGDLDLVINNINRDAFVFINNTIRKGQPVSSHFIAIDMQGEPLNPHGFGARLSLFNKGHIQVREQSPVRGYFSSVDQRLFFGMGEATMADSITIDWPGGGHQAITHVKTDTLITIHQHISILPPHQTVPLIPIIEDITSQSRARYRHLDAPFNDYTLQRLLPQKFSQLGPFLTTGDINGDGLQDFFAGGGFNSSGAVFLQQRNGTFSSYKLCDSIKMQEDEDCALFDADGDGDLDLFITCGDTRFEEGSPWYIPRLYTNDGKGHFTLQPGAIPADLRTIAGCVSIADYDGDGDMDIFIGGRVSSSYPLPPRSYILQNNKGIFRDATAEVCPALKTPGMVTAAIWARLDGHSSGLPDLLIAGEYMPLRFFHNEGGHLQDITDKTGLKDNNGMWRSLAIADIDNDGDPDVVAGNLGLNCDYKTDSLEPMQVWAKDLDGNGSIEAIPSYYLKGPSGKRRSYPAVNRSQMARQLPAIKKRFLLNKDFAEAAVDDLLKGWSRDGMLILSCTETRSCWFENKGHGKFEKHALPAEAQFAPVNAILCNDLDHDGYPDLLLAGNEYQTEVITGRYDASYGCWLKGGKDAHFTALSPVSTGFILRGDVRDMALLPSAAGGRLLIAAVNNDSLRVFNIRTSPSNPPSSKAPSK